MGLVITYPSFLVSCGDVVSFSVNSVFSCLKVLFKANRFLMSLGSFFFKKKIKDVFFWGEEKKHHGLENNLKRDFPVKEKAFTYASIEKELMEVSDVLSEDFAEEKVGTISGEKPAKLSGGLREEVENVESSGSTVFEEKKDLNFLFEKANLKKKGFVKIEKLKLDDESLLFGGSFSEICTESFFLGKENKGKRFFFLFSFFRWPFFLWSFFLFMRPSLLFLPHLKVDLSAFTILVSSIPSIGRYPFPFEVRYLFSVYTGFF